VTFECLGVVARVERAGPRGEPAYAQRLEESLSSRPFEQLSLRRFRVSPHGHRPHFTESRPEAVLRRLELCDRITASREECGRIEKNWSIVQQRPLEAPQWGGDRQRLRG
jgi:hypothetical protein